MFTASRRPTVDGPIPEPLSLGCKHVGMTETLHGGGSFVCCVIWIV